MGGVRGEHGVPRRVSTEYRPAANHETCPVEGYIWSYVWQLNMGLVDLGKEGLEYLG